MTADAIAKALGGRKAGAAWMARCPAHDDRAPSLSIADARDGKVLVRCHAGCDQRDVIAALRARGAWDVDERRPIRLSRRPDRVPPPEIDGDAISEPKRPSPSGAARNRPRARRSRPISGRVASSFQSRRRSASMPG